MTITAALLPLLSFRFRTCAPLEFELIALRLQAIATSSPVSASADGFSECVPRSSKPWYSSNRSVVERPGWPKATDQIRDHVG